MHTLVLIGKPLCTGSIQYPSYSTFTNYIDIFIFSYYRFRNRSVRLPTMRQSSSFQNVKEADTANVYINESNISDYQELREFNKAETYDALEFMAKK